MNRRTTLGDKVIPCLRAGRMQGADPAWTQVPFRPPSQTATYCSAWRIRGQRPSRVMTGRGTAVSSWESGAAGAGVSKTLRADPSLSYQPGSVWSQCAEPGLGPGTYMDERGQEVSMKHMCPFRILLLSSRSFPAKPVSSGAPLSQRRSKARAQAWTPLLGHFGCGAPQELGCDIIRSRLGPAALPA